MDDAALVSVLLPEVEGLPPVGERAVLVALNEEDVADVVVALGELLLVAEVAADLERLLVVLPRGRVVCATLVQRAEVVGHVGEALLVADRFVGLARRSQVGLGLVESSHQDLGARAVLEAHRGAPAVADALAERGGVSVLLGGLGVVAQALVCDAHGVEDVALALLVAE